MPVSQKTQSSKSLMAPSPGQQELGREGGGFSVSWGFGKRIELPWGSRPLWRIQAQDVPEAPHSSGCL